MNSVAGEEQALDTADELAAKDPPPAEHFSRARPPQAKDQNPHPERSEATAALLQVERDRTREWQRLEKLLEGCLIKLSSAVHSLARTKTARIILEAVADGERDTKALAALAMGPADRSAIEKSLNGMQAGDHHPALIRGLLDHAACLDRRVTGVPFGPRLAPRGGAGRRWLGGTAPR